ncbi:DUF3489 domain-containing protein [Blastomonas marina]|uniref:DUF3489 domain-containing protein n=1 Tax=Blastomonas marina TaxID=1867408 RepID=UPI002AC9B5B9|nr:DUF3489 domain-containing protein [Blastomonas marina]WPZ03947.1 DUF3489 domain-containing protein [Blastomonas marina]
MTMQTIKRPAGSMKTATEKAAAKPRETKIGKVIALLEHKDGATLDEMVEATGWLPHTTRAALTGLKKKKGLTIERDKRGDKACYRITKSA